MQAKPDKSEQQNPADIAREAFRRLAIRRISPTPEAYRDIYNEVAGNTTKLNADAVLGNFTASLSRSGPADIAEFGRRLQRAIDVRDWPTYLNELNQLVEKHLKKVTVNQASIAAAPLEDHQIRLLRDLLARTLTFAVATLLSGAPELASESESLGAVIKEAYSENALNEVAIRLKQLCFKIELKSGDMAEQHELLLRLFKLLLDNVKELLENDCWLHGQIDIVQQLMSGPVNHRALEDATRSLKEVIYKQGLLKHSLSEAKTSVKDMMSTLIDRLGAVAESTGDYHQKIDQHSLRISQAKDGKALGMILNDVLRETRIVQTDTLRSRDEMIAARQEVQNAEERIRTLETKLDQMSELIREDQLTGSLNRRGLDDVFERELARADRRALPLCVAMLDLDDFKRLNDTHGHSTGDEALIHMVRIAKETLRTMDVIARFGGEEFLILFPDTTIKDATLVLTRLQRALTKHFFLHENEKVLITFSAGVALRLPNEDQTSVVKRADEALYKAKKAGKNRVVAAD